MNLSHFETERPAGFGDRIELLWSGGVLSEHLIATTVGTAYVSTIRRHNGEFETIIFDGPSTEEGNPVYPWPSKPAAFFGHAQLVDALQRDPGAVPALPPTEEREVSDG